MSFFLFPISYSISNIGHPNIIMVFYFYVIIYMISMKFDSNRENVFVYNIVVVVCVNLGKFNP